MSMTDPGGDRREWEIEWQALEPELRDAPAEALPEVVADFLQAREAPLAVAAGETVDPSDVGNAVDAYRRLYEYLLGQGPAAGR